MRKRGTTVINQPEEQRAQSMLMLADRLSGASVKTLGARYSFSRRAVLRRLALARVSGPGEDAQTHIVETLVPEALHDFNQALEAGDVSGHTQVPCGTGALFKNPKSFPPPPPTTPPTNPTHRTLPSRPRT